MAKFNKIYNQAIIYCIIPAFNEEKSIKEVIMGVKPYVHEIIVVDDGSTDETYNIVKISGATLLRHIVNRGQGAALRTGTDYAISQGADIIVHYDADGQFMAQDIIKVVEPIIAGQAEVVFGSRFLDSRLESNIPFFKKNIILPLAKIANSLFLNINLTDPQSGFRAMSRYAAEKIEWQQDGMAHCSEILFEVKANKLSVSEVPIRVIYHNFGQKFFGGIKILKDLLLARLLN